MSFRLVLERQGSCVITWMIFSRVYTKYRYRVCYVISELEHCSSQVSTAVYTMLYINGYAVMRGMDIYKSPALDLLQVSYDFI